MQNTKYTKHKTLICIEEYFVCEIVMCDMAAISRLLRIIGLFCKRAL